MDAAEIAIPAALDDEHRRHVVAGEPMIFHCHHYNTFLQRSILDAEYLDSRPFLVGAAAEVAYAQLSRWFTETGVTETAQRCRMAETMYRWAGFGTLDMCALGADGGDVKTPNSHYSFGWQHKFGPSKEPVDFFGAGWLAGAAAAVYGLPLGSFATEQVECLATPDGTENVYTLTRGDANYPAWRSVGLGPLSEAHAPRAVPPSPVDYEGIYGAVTGLPLAGDERGMIPAFGVYLTHHYANYYNRISFEFERALIDEFGEMGREVAKPLLVEAGHVCAFHTFGGIMTSPEWDALIRPSLETCEDWVHGIVAVVNALGWGRWQVTEVTPDSAVFVIHDDYESVGYLGMYGETDHNVAYLAEGGVMGVMDLVYVGNISEKPDLTPAFYDRLFKSADSYSAELLEARADGGLVTAFRVSR